MHFELVVRFFSEHPELHSGEPVWDVTHYQALRRAELNVQRVGRMVCNGREVVIAGDPKRER